MFHSEGTGPEGGKGQKDRHATEAGAMCSLVPGRQTPSSDASGAGNSSGEKAEQDQRGWR